MAEDPESYFVKLETEAITNHLSEEKRHFALSIYRRELARLIENLRLEYKQTISKGLPSSEKTTQHNANSPSTPGGITRIRNTRR